MSQAPDDPISRALAALDRLHAAHPDPQEAASWQEARTALSEAQGERFTFLVVVAAARKLIADLEGYEAAAEDADLEAIAGLAAACTLAEDALARALARVHTEAGAVPRPSSEDDEEGDQDDGTPSKGPNLRMRFGAEMNDPPPPPPAPLPTPEEPANTDREPEEKP